MMTNKQPKIGLLLLIILAIGNAYAEDSSVDPAATRNIWGPNALPNPAKTLRITAIDFGIWHFDHPVGESVDLGVQMTAPFGVLIGGPTLRTSHELSENIHAGLFANVGAGVAFTNGNGAAYYGGGPMITFGDLQKSVTISSLFYGAAAAGGSGLAWLPSIAASYQPKGKGFKFNIEMFSLNGVEPSYYGKALAVLYGARFFSKSGGFFADVDFVCPIFDGAGDFYRVMPLGLPFIGMGWVL